MIPRVKEAITTRKPSIVREVYPIIFGKNLNKGCNSCIPDALIELEIWLKKETLKNSSVNLFVNYYHSDNPKREKELQTARELNEANEHITRIINVDSRKYSDFFEAMKSYPDDVNIIANADIFFNETIEKAKLIWTNTCYALTRWDYKQGQAVFMNRKDSQDAWIFRGSPKNVKADFSLGIPGCDNRIAWEIKKAGYVVRNPSKTIQIIHLHETNLHTYTSKDKIEEPYLFLEPTELI